MRGSSSVEMGRLNVTSIRCGLTRASRKGQKRLAVISVIKTVSSPSAMEVKGLETEQMNSFIVFFVPSNMF